MGTPARNTSNIFRTFKAASDIGAGKVVKFSTYDTDNDVATVAHATAGTDKAIGVATQAALQGERVEVQVGFGTDQLCVAGADIAAGADVMASTAGVVITATGATVRSLGIAVRAALSGEDVQVFWMPSLNGPANS